MDHEKLAEQLMMAGQPDDAIISTLLGSGVDTPTAAIMLHKARRRLRQMATSPVDPPSAAAMQLLAKVSPPLAELPRAKDSRTVFVVHGRDEEIRSSMFAFLRAINLKPLEWTEVIASTNSGSPFVGEALEAAFAKAQAVVVLMTPDDEASLKEEFWTKGDGKHEREATGQARPNVLFEAGMAMGRDADHTILVEIGELRPFSDVGGRHVVKLDNSVGKRHQLAIRLKTAGCDVNTDGTDWQSAGRFETRPTKRAQTKPARRPTGSKPAGPSAAQLGTAALAVAAQFLMPEPKPRGAGAKALATAKLEECVEIIRIRGLRGFELALQEVRQVQRKLDAAQAQITVVLGDTVRLHVLPNKEDKAANGEWRDQDGNSHYERMKATQKGEADCIISGWEGRRTAIAWENLDDPKCMVVAEAHWLEREGTT